MDRSAFKRKLKAILRERGITQKELAAEIGCPPQNLSEMVNGKRNDKRLLDFLSERYGEDFTIDDKTEQDVAPIAEQDTTPYLYKMKKSALMELMKTFISEKNLKQVDMAGALNVSQSRVSDMINGKRDPKRLLEYLSENYDFNINEIAVANNGERGWLPESSFAFAAGQTTLVYDGVEPNRKWYIPDCTDCDAVVPVDGDSMAPNIPPGSYVVLKRFNLTGNNPNSIPFGQVFGVVVEDDTSGEYHGYIKVLRRYKDADMSSKYWIAHSFNPEYDDFDIHLEQVRSLWIVKQHIVTNISY